MEDSKQVAMGAKSSSRRMRMMRKGGRGPRAKKQIEKGNITKCMILMSKNAGNECNGNGMKRNGSDIGLFEDDLSSENDDGMGGGNLAKRSRLETNLTTQMKGPQSKTGQMHGKKLLLKQQKNASSKPIIHQGLF